ncbi:uncharacterized protein RHOBADRAFT_56029 [Rhodotorula graminis WP1]|uniref:Uncharacterized protein n=1 Tax=Rhodotorula graminis (strain WP1) TaxID=578459 RepID=A0A0P9ESA7_RHOGW|nr:uncharacterized protein RHOBADRAFT_56029 [Rhodotorula graminis WP1]KPV72210.1 hypothetical protein RHOBADRAFT_56029 [Rhodotorula graminis WP1]
MDRLPVEVLALILPGVDEFPPSSYGSAAFKARQAELRKLCRVSKGMRRVARRLLWRIVVVDTEEQASSLIRLVLSPSTSEVANFIQILGAAQAKSRRVFRVDKASGRAPGLLAPTTVFRLVANLSALQRVYLLDFDPVQRADTSFDGKIGIDFSSGGPLRKLHSLVITGGMPYLKRVLAPVAHALVELALPANFKASAEDVEQVLSSRVLPHLRRLRLGVPSSRGFKPRPVLSAPTTAFLAQLDYVQLVDPVLSSSGFYEDRPEPIPLDHPYLVTDTPVLVDISSSTSLPRESSPALDLVDHLYVRSVPDWSRLADVVSHAHLVTLCIPEKVWRSSASESDELLEVCSAAGVALYLAARDKHAVILPGFVAYCEGESDETDSK